ncbi:hypothetical protein HMPREF0063_12816 [Aeromicrobium marinum DSM 15272]|uniref:AbiEi antitoxin N-terminal domain-containing protein n=1 Tax=Aeromicrobium marinum DSM 15272 TaxID=585531 RepID=E2SFK7_9ACTN|nr:type IV toxin-antitoxin system AbiEi family antitoxin domain-containing protein [Aeromicrobium marinum]EFQ82108.1 hypothetical protein HMPREF0063_12816 [Aeromicrobium marinum DSM 15272]
MKDDLIHRAELRGFITRTEILDSGYLDRDIREAIAIGLLTRIGSGLYAVSRTYTALTFDQRHAVRSRAVFQRHLQSVVLTHQSAAIMHGLPVWGLSLDEVHVTRRDHGRGRHEAGVQHHTGRIPDADIVEIDGALVSSPSRCVWEVACSASTEAGLVTADAAAHRGLVTPENLGETAATFAHWQGSRSARITTRLIDPRAESPGESRSRHLFWRFDVPMPDLQHRVLDARGRQIARTDFGWELWRHLAEFDGRIKYDGTFTPEGFESVFDEKRREDSIRAQEWGMSRIVWADLEPARAPHTAARILADLDRSRSRYGRRVVL